MRSRVCESNILIRILMIERNIERVIYNDSLVPKCKFQFWDPFREIADVERGSSDFDNVGIDFRDMLPKNLVNFGQNFEDLRKLVLAVWMNYSPDLLPSPFRNSPFKIPKVVTYRQEFWNVI